MLDVGCFGVLEPAGFDGDAESAVVGSIGVGADCAAVGCVDSFASEG